MYDITLKARAADGTRIDMVHVPHEPHDADKIIRIREAMKRGERIRPVIMIDAGDHCIAISGTHRIAASMGLDGALTVTWLPADLTADEWDLISAANDDEERLAAIADVAARRDDMEDVLAAMHAEVDANKGE